MQALSSVPVDVMPAAPPAAASSASTGQEGLFASNLKTATEKQTTAERPSKTANKQSGSTPTTDKLSSAPEDADSTEETGEEASLAATPNGSAGAALQQFATSQKSDEGVSELKGGSDASLSLVQSNKSAMDKLLESLTTPTTTAPLTTTTASGSAQDGSVAVSTQQETAAQQPALPSQPFGITEKQGLATVPSAVLPDMQISTGHRNLSASQRSKG